MSQQRKIEGLLLVLRGTEARDATKTFFSTQREEKRTLMKADKALRMILENGTYDHNVI